MVQAVLQLLIKLKRNWLAIVHSDDERGIQRLNQKLRKLVRGNRAVTIFPKHGQLVDYYNPAKAAGIYGKMGSIVVAKMPI